ncbi:ornithine cyclodeaminase family protein [Agromyces sp. SYSU K20354]|uniref:ornithine cyclodeaminase family protein n=1 Tax=Agromyces cavernae TaxID=2898659 RepID=UPI001E50CEA9|nr:ornithine cyclodeaminase family protein [Agromyces cavernae]MCD2442025.1 ornithine cyclodeaminase family protein [Agromyces cavernae]
MFPVVIGHTLTEGQRFTVKSGSTGTATGVKVGTYWHGNSELGLPRHGSTTLLLDPETGRLSAVIEAAAANAMRTAAADALAVQALARDDASTLTVVGTGTQAFYEAAAVARVRPIARVLISGRSEAKAAQLADRLSAHLSVPVTPTSIQAAVEAADVLVTVTTSREPLFNAEWVRPGTHVSAMGADGPGKQELPTALHARAALFCDVIEQTRTLGEFQHAPQHMPITPLRDVLRGDAPGRVIRDQVTIFDSSGFALQDLTLAEHILAAHTAREAT